MNIKVNGKAIEIFSGARVEDALRRHSSRSWKQVCKGSKRVVDGRGHEVALGGELNGGEELFVKLARPGRSGA